jgi:methylated-DNA-protein-cysteine methyltransferase-like protein
MAGSDSYRRIYAVVARIPRGRVATYGQVAALAKLPRQARLVGYALAALPPDSDVPWHRVVNAKGQVSPRGNGLGHEELQAQFLAREGVRFVAGAIPLARFRWAPRGAGAGVRATKLAGARLRAERRPRAARGRAAQVSRRG